MIYHNIVRVVSLFSAKLRQFSINHLWITLKVGFERIIYNHFMCVWNRCWATFSEYILGGQEIYKENIYQMQIWPSIYWNCHLHLGYIFLYRCVLTPKNSCFCPSKCPRDKKGQKKYVPRVSGAQPRDKIDFLAKRKIS